MVVIVVGNSSSNVDTYVDISMNKLCKFMLNALEDSTQACI